MADETQAPNERYKVGCILSKYGLDKLHAELPRRWLGDGREFQSLRTLADEINIRILEEAMRAAGLDTLEGEAQNAYRLLTDDDVSAGMQTQQQNRLAHNGVDVDEITDDFVTHQAVYVYLTDALGVSKEADEPNTSVEKHDQRINRLRSRTEAVTGATMWLSMYRCTIMNAEPRMISLHSCAKADVTVLEANYIHMGVILPVHQVEPLTAVAVFGEIWKPLNMDVRSHSLRRTSAALSELKSSLTQV